jgi:cyclophilin family peptidyl-prolyl cis-trans isomerase
MRFRSITFALALGIGAALGASDLPAVLSPLPMMTVSAVTNVPLVDLRSYFTITGFREPVVQFETSLGTFNLALFPSAAPITVTNFLGYVNSGKYVNSVVHRSDKLLGLIQGGGYYRPMLDPVPTNSPIPLEYNIPNTNSTIAMARTYIQNSATSQWFINRNDNTEVFGQANGGGYAVFGRVTGTGMDVANFIGSLPTYEFSVPFDQLPLWHYTGGVVLEGNYVAVTWAQEVPLFPPLLGGRAVVQFTVTNSNPAVATVTAEGSSLRVMPVGGALGSANVTVTATDSNGNSTNSTFFLQVTNPDGSSGWVQNPIFGWLWNAGQGWYGGSGYGWLWDDPASEWIWSTALQGWMATTDPNSRTLWSTQFRWLTPSSTDTYLADTTSIGQIHVGQYNGAPISEGWVVSDRFGYIWPNSDGVWFYSDKYGWLGVTADGGIWCVNEGRFL